MKIRHLRTKIILISIPVLLMGAIAFYTESNMYIMPGFQKIEDELDIKNANRSVDVLTERLNQLNQKASTWGNSDETYDFMKDRNKTYIANELGNSTLNYLRIDYILFFDTKGQLVEMKHVLIDDPSMRSLPIGKGIKALFTPSSPLLQHATNTDVHMGAITTSDGMTEIVARPILDSDGNGPIRGTIVFVKNIDADVTKEMADITHLNLKFLPANDPSVTKSIPSYPSKTTKGTQWLSRISGTQTQAFSIIPDVLGKPSIVARVDIARTISQQGRNSLRTFLLASLFVGLLIVITTALLLNKLIVNRIITMSKQLRDLDDIQNSTRVVGVRGNDELTHLGSTINDLLLRLHNTYTLKQTNQTLEQLVNERTEELDDQLDQVKRINGLMIDRELRMKDLKQQNAKLRKQLGED